jgi:hypothetical protein
MSYGVVISKDSFVFTRYGVVSLKQLPMEAEVLGVEGIGKHTKYRKVTLHNESKSGGTRLITQTTDSVLVPETIVFSERALKTNELCSAVAIEFHNPSKSPEFRPGVRGKMMDWQMDAAYGFGLTTNVVSRNKKRIVSLVRNAPDPKYIKFIEHCITSLADSRRWKISVTIKRGKLGHLWIILKGNTLGELHRIICDAWLERACMQLSAKQLKNFVAGMLDAYINQPLYGGDPVLMFSKDNSVQKRFLQSMLILYNSRIVETSCITSHAPKFLESTAMVEKEVPTKNPTWRERSEVTEGPELFSRIRGRIQVQTTSTNLVFKKEGFSPIVDGLYTYPHNLSK